MKLNSSFKTGLLIASTLSLAAFTSSEAMIAKSSNIKGNTRVLKGKIEQEVAAADQLMTKGKFAEADEMYKEALNHNTKCVPAYVGLGMALARQFKLDAASDAFNKALALDPRSAMALSGKAIIDFNRLQSSSFTVIKNKVNILQTAESECKQGLAIDPGMPEAHYTLGMVYKEQGRLPEAISEFQEAAKQDPKYSEAYSGLGMAQLGQNDVFGAMQSFKKAVELNSGNSTAHYGLGVCNLKQGQLDNAIKELNTSLAQFPNSAPATLAMGDAYNAQGNTVAAIRQYQEAIRIKPENSDAYMHIADIREARGDLEHSIAELRSGLELMPGNSDLRMRIGDESLKLEKLDDAVKEYETVMQTNPRNSQAAKGLTRALYLKANKEAGGAFFGSNEYESAQRLIDRTVAMNPNDMELRLAQAKMRALSGTTVDLSNVGVPTNDGERIAYAEALLAQNKFKDADAEMSQVIANANTAKQAFAVADLALMIKDLPDAEAAYRKAAVLPGGGERARRGLDAVAKAKDTARQDLTLADDLARRKQLASAVDKYHSAIFGNPKSADARIGLAQTLERLSPQASKDLREAIVEYKAYISLSPNLPPKELEKLNKRMTKLENKAYKLDQKGKSK